MDAKQAFAKNLQHYMKLKGVSRQDLCDDLNLKYPTLSAWCQGRKVPGPNITKQLADYFGVTVDDLYNGADFIYATHITPKFDELVDSIGNAIPFSEEEHVRYTHSMETHDLAQDAAKVLELLSRLQKLNADGLGKVEEYIDDLADKYKK